MTPKKDPDLDFVTILMVIVALGSIAIWEMVKYLFSHLTWVP